MDFSERLLELKARATRIQWVDAYRDIVPGTLNAAELEKLSHALDVQEKLYKKCTALCGFPLPRWFFEAYAYPLCEEDIEQLPEKINFNRQWKDKLSQLYVKIAPKYRGLLPQTEDLLTPQNIHAVVQEYKKYHQESYWYRTQKLIQSLWKSTKKYSTRNGLISLSAVDFGEFYMGASKRDNHALREEKPAHKVYLSYDLWVMRHPCTQLLYKDIMGENPSHFQHPTHPVECVSWCDAVVFCNRLSTEEFLEPVYSYPTPIENTRAWSQQVHQNIKANGYRLLSEAEWEYIARSGKHTLYAGGSLCGELAWYGENSSKETHPVGQKKETAWGLHDMSGNVWEWVWDRRYRKYDLDSQVDPFCDKSRKQGRVRRGGSWVSSAAQLRCTCRDWGNPTDRDNITGFRVARLRK